MKLKSLNILFLGTPEDNTYLHCLKEATAGHKVYVNMTKVDTLSEVAMIAEARKCTHVITTQKIVIAKLSDTASSKEQTIDNYAGSILEDTKNGLTYLIVSPLKQCVTMSYGQFVLNRYISKITREDKWVVTDKFSYLLVQTPAQLEDCLEAVASSLFTSIDIETRKDLSISSISYTAMSVNGETSTYVIPIPMGKEVYEYEFLFAWIAKINSTSAPKVGQNFKYDIAYLNRYGCPVVGWLYDTAALHHCWYAELPKDLGTLAAFYVRNSIFWKNEGEGDLDNLYRYNALDTWYTAWVLMGWLAEAPKWAVKNYLQEFPVLIPAVLAEATGFKVDYEIFKSIRTREKGKVAKELESLGKNLVPGFNPGSSQQVKKMLVAIGCKDIKSSEEKYLKKAAYRHPYNQWLIDKILNYRKAAKLVSTYLNEDKFFCGRVLYSLTPYGTTTGRLASKSHAFWTGLQIQNIPRKGGIKDFLIADDGFLIGEADYAQAESRDTGYISGDTNLISAVDGDNDFHSFNASSFFGVPYESICRNNPDGSHTVLDKELRQLAKPVNHGKNYNMGEGVLVDTMGLPAIFAAGKKLGLPKNYTAIQIARYLGIQFEKTYPVLTHDYQEWIKYQVSNVHMLVGATGWTRYCFGNPLKNKPALNAYIAHPPQSLNAMTLNKAFVKVFWEVWLAEYRDFKLCAQIHDSILFQYRKGREDLVDRVEDCMLMDIEVADIKGIKRTLRVPVDVSSGGRSWSDSKD